MLHVARIPHVGVLRVHGHIPIKRYDEIERLTGFSIHLVFILGHTRRRPYGRLKATEQMEVGSS